MYFIKHGRTDVVNILEFEVIVQVQIHNQIITISQTYDVTWLYNGDM